MEKSIFEKDFADLLNQNFDKYSKYFDLSYKVFHELNTSVFEIAKCLILDLNKAAITLTNHMLERLLKLALIYNEVGIQSKSVDSLNQTYQNPVVVKYGKLVLGKTIEECRIKGLITKEEHDFLYDTVREVFRNGFSHADYSKILEGVSDTLPGYSASLAGEDGVIQVSLNPKTIPFLQSVTMERFAKQNAGDYFKTVINLLTNIEERMVRKSANLPD